jgi:hypothetical protein
MSPINHIKIKLRERASALDRISLNVDKWKYDLVLKFSINWGIKMTIQLARLIEPEIPLKAVQISSVGGRPVDKLADIDILSKVVQRTVHGSGSMRA